jgi:hypothetical protein
VSLYSSPTAELFTTGPQADRAIRFIKGFGRKEVEQEVSDLRIIQKSDAVAKCEVRSNKSLACALHESIKQHIVNTS